MAGSIWNYSYSITVPTDLIIGVMCLLVALLFFWRLIRWRDRNPGTVITDTPVSVCYPVIFFLLAAGVFGYYAYI